MEDSCKRMDFLNYINKPLENREVKLLYKNNNINYDTTLLFSDYIQSLLSLIFDTYMGDEITSLDDRVNHFNWCWKKNISNFEEEGILFEDTDESFNYFLEFMIEVYYSVDNKKDNILIPFKIRKIWYDIFSFKKRKTHSDVDNFLEIYKILGESLKKG